VRHIPEEELHAYLDQALSRSQCIEIETHLAVCFPCQGERDSIAALRDRTTRLLGLAAPPARVRAPAWTELEGQAMVRRQGRSWRRMGIWAASLAGAVLAGWGLRTLSSTPVEQIAFRPEAPAIFAVSPNPAPVQTVANVSGDDTAEFGADDGIGLVGSRPRRVEPPAPAPASGAVSRPLSLPGDWSTVSLPDAEDETGGLVARVNGLPVLQVQFRAFASGRPMMLVTQTQLTGERVYVVEGPVSQVADLVSAQLGNGMVSSEPSRSLPDYDVGANGERVRRNSRVVAVIGRLPADSLNALAAGVVLK
jgi:hypothetical protein